MKKTFSIATAFGFFVATAYSQTPVAQVGVGFVNAVGLPSKTDVFIDGQTVKPAGFAAGGYATSLAMNPGTHTLTFANSGAEGKIVQQVEAKEGSSSLYVLFNVVVPQKDGTVKNVLKLATLPSQAPPRAPTFFVFSTLEGRVAPIKVNGNDVQIAPLKLTLVEGTTLTAATSAAKPIRYDPAEAANYVLVLFDGPKSTVRSSLVEMAR